MPSRALQPRLLAERVRRDRTVVQQLSLVFYRPSAILLTTSDSPLRESTPSFR